jgi:hypothetical protein
MKNQCTTRALKHHSTRNGGRKPAVQQYPSASGEIVKNPDPCHLHQFYVGGMSDPSNASAVVRASFPYHIAVLAVPQFQHQPCKDAVSMVALACEMFMPYTPDNLGHIQGVMKCAR